MRVLVTGAKGMLGTDLCQVLEAAGHEPQPTDVRGEGLSATLDITSIDQARGALSQLAPDVVIHCAAYTNVDQAEREPDAAYRVNALGSWVMAAACHAAGIPLAAISTDFVFDGEKGEPYTEFDAPNPLGVYGASKLAGESCIRQVAPRHWIVRTAWLYGAHGKCFPDTMIRAAETRPELRVIQNQRGTPTYTRDLASALVRIIESPLYGTYHVANAGTTTWYDFARKALELAGHTKTRVVPITAAEWPSPTRRPASSALRPYALELQGAPLPRPWEEALADYVAARAQAVG
jgi:dTDP-4-dehydrorhamnose reductase